MSHISFWDIIGMEFKIARRVLDVESYQIEMLTGISSKLLEKFEDGKQIPNADMIRQSYQTALNFIYCNRFKCSPKYRFSCLATYEPAELIGMLLYHHTILPSTLENVIQSCDCRCHVTAEVWQVFNEKGSFVIKIQ